MRCLHRGVAASCCDLCFLVSVALMKAVQEWNLLPQKGSGKPVSRLRGREDVSLCDMELILLVSRVLQL